LFLSRSIRRPQAIGAVAPSSRWLARALAGQVGAHSNAPVVELGAGTGVVTRALLEAGIRPARLVVVERDVELHALLSRRFAAVKVLRVDARRLQRALRRKGIAGVGTVVSSLPLRSMSVDVRLSILEQCFAVLGHSGAFIQYSYGLRLPLSRRLLAAHDLSAIKAGFVARNLPPATIWRFERAALDKGCTDGAGDLLGSSGNGARR